FIKKSKYRNFSEFLLPYKHERVFRYYKHQHNICHRSMVGYQHIALAFFHLLVMLNLIIETHTDKDDLCPEPGNNKKLRIGLIRQYGNNKYWGKDYDRDTHKNVKPYSPKGPKNELYYFHMTKCNNSNSIFYQNTLPLL